MGNCSSVNRKSDIETPKFSDHRASRKLVTSSNLTSRVNNDVGHSDSNHFIGGQHAKSHKNSDVQVNVLSVDRFISSGDSSLRKNSSTGNFKTSGSYSTFASLQSGHHVDVRSLPELPPAMFLAAAFNDVCFFRSIPVIEKAIELMSRRANILHSKEWHASHGGVHSPDAISNNEPLFDPITKASLSSSEEMSSASVLKRTVSCDSTKDADDSHHLKTLHPHLSNTAGSSIHPSPSATSVPGPKLVELFNACDKHGDTILMIAAAAGSYDLMELFLTVYPKGIKQLKGFSNNSLFHFATLGPSHLTDLLKAVRAHVLQNPDLLATSTADSVGLQLCLDTEAALSSGNPSGLPSSEGTARHTSSPSNLKELSKEKPGYCLGAGSYLSPIEDSEQFPSVIPGLSSYQNPLPPVTPAVPTSVATGPIALVNTTSFDNDAASTTSTASNSTANISAATTAGCTATAAAAATATAGGIVDLSRTPSFFSKEMTDAPSPRPITRRPHLSPSPHSHCIGGPSAGSSVPSRSSAAFMHHAVDDPLRISGFSYLKALMTYTQTWETSNCVEDVYGMLEAVPLSEIDVAKCQSNCGAFNCSPVPPFIPPTGVAVCTTLPPAAVILRNGGSSVAPLGSTALPFTAPSGVSSGPGATVSNSSRLSPLPVLTASPPVGSKRQSRTSASLPPVPSGDDQDENKVKEVEIDRKKEIVLDIPSCPSSLSSAENGSSSSLPSDKEPRAMATVPPPLNSAAPSKPSSPVCPCSRDFVALGKVPNLGHGECHIFPYLLPPQPTSGRQDGILSEQQHLLELARKDINLVPLRSRFPPRAILQTVEVLLAHGLRPTVKNQFQKLPWDLAFHQAQLPPINGCIAVGGDVNHEGCHILSDPPWDMLLKGPCSDWEAVCSRLKVAQGVHTLNSSTPSALTPGAFTPLHASTIGNTSTKPPVHPSLSTSNPNTPLPLNVLSNALGNSSLHNNNTCRIASTQADTVSGTRNPTLSA